MAAKYKIGPLSQNRRAYLQSSGNKKQGLHGKDGAYGLEALLTCNTCDKALPNAPDCKLTLKTVAQFLEDHEKICCCKPPHCEVCKCVQCEPSMGENAVADINLKQSPEFLQTGQSISDLDYTRRKRKRIVHEHIAHKSTPKSRFPPQPPAFDIANNNNSTPERKFPTQPPPLDISCNVCGLVLPSVKQLSKHMVLLHKTSHAWKCEFCFHSFLKGTS